MDIQRVLRDMPYQIKSALTLHNKMKRQLLTAIKEYLRFKYKQTTSVYPDDEDVSGLLEENSFSPCDVAVFNKYDCASSSALNKIRLEKNQLIVDTVESGSILNEEALYYEDLINICDTIEKYERAIHMGISHRMKYCRWKIRAAKILLNKTGESLEEILDFVDFYWKPNMPEEHNIELFKSIINH